MTTLTHTYWNAAFSYKCLWGRWCSGDPGIWNYAKQFSVSLLKVSPFVSLLNPSFLFLLSQKLLTFNFTQWSYCFTRNNILILSFVWQPLELFESLLVLVFPLFIASFYRKILIVLVPKMCFGNSTLFDYLVYARCFPFLS